MPKTTLPFEASKAAQQSAISTSRFALMFTYTLGMVSSGNNPLADATGGPGTVNDRLKRMGVDVQIGELGVARELVVGAGWKSARVEQSINVSQEGALGHYEIVETIEHGVASNTFTASHMAIRWSLLSHIGLAPWGVDTLVSPLLNCYMFDPLELQRGNNVGYVRVEGLHIQTNALDANLGQTVMENVTFRPHRIRKVDNKLDEAAVKRWAEMFPETARDMALFPQNFSYNQAY